MSLCDPPGCRGRERGWDPGSGRLARQRAGIYEDLARLYLPPSWDQIQGTLSQVLLKHPRFLLDSRDTHFHAAKELDRHEKESYRLGLESFEAEYVRLFVNSREGVLAPPHASFYTEGSLLGRTAREALAYYERFGITPDTARNEPPDHIVYELEFLSFLCSMEQKALDRTGAQAAELRRTQADFLRNHLFPWAGRFCDRIMANSRLAYYQLVGAFTKGFLGHERGLIDNPCCT